MAEDPYRYPGNTYRDGSGYPAPARAASASGYPAGTYVSAYEQPSTVDSPQNPPSVPYGSDQTDSYFGQPFFSSEYPPQGYGEQIQDDGLPDRGATSNYTGNKHRQDSRGQTQRPRRDTRRDTNGGAAVATVIGALMGILSKPLFKSFQTRSSKESRAIPSKKDNWADPSSTERLLYRWVPDPGDNLGKGGFCGTAAGEDGSTSAEGPCSQRTNGVMYAESYKISLKDNPRQMAYRDIEKPTFTMWLCDGHAVEAGLANWPTATSSGNEGSGRNKHRHKDNGSKDAPSEPSGSSHHRHTKHEHRRSHHRHREDRLQR